MASEPIRITWLLGMLCVSLLIIFVCIYHWWVLSAVKQRDDLKTMRQVVRKAKKALQAGKLSAVEIAVLATQAGMTMEQIEEEYRKDSQARREVLMSVLGDSSNPFVQKFLQRYPSRFLSAGYDLEDQFVHNDTVAELEQIRSALNK